jgi:hypothetical protein
MTTVDIAIKRAEAQAIADRRSDAINAQPATTSKQCPPHASRLHRIAATITAEDLPPARITISDGAVDVDLTGTELVENGVRRYAAAINSPVTETPFDVQGFAATKWTASGWLDGSWWSISGTELLPAVTR